MQRSNSQQVDLLEWREGGVVDGSVLYLWEANGWLGHKRYHGYDDYLRYEYDALGRIDRLTYGPLLTPSPTELEIYSYDLGHNPLSLYRDGLGTYTYGPTLDFNEVPSRERVTAGGTAVESFSYDAVTGRLLTWDRVGGGLPPFERTYTYDGAGRLRVAERVDPSGTRTHRMHLEGPIPRSSSTPMERSRTTQSGRQTHRIQQGSMK